MGFWNTEPHRMSDEDRLRAAMRLVRAATGGEPSGSSQDWVTDAGIGYTGGTSASSGMTDVWVTGDWNDRRRTDNIGRVIVDKTPQRLFEALERIGVNGEWLDEYDRCDDCQRLIRTSPDCYAWVPQYVIFDERGVYGDYSAGDMVCADCLRDNAESVIADQYANNPHRAITWLSAADLTELGWRDAMPDSYDAETGLYPGQNDTPDAVVERFRASLDGDRAPLDYVFLITDKGQFDIHYRLFVRESESEEL